MSKLAGTVTLGSLLLAPAACGIDRLDQEGRCPTKELATSFDGADLGLLRGYTRVGGDLTVPEGTKSLSALRCLETVDGELGIDSLPHLKNLDGLENLRSTGGLSVASLPALTNTEGLSGLEEIHGGLAFENLRHLRAITTPDGIRVDGSVWAHDLDALEEWSGTIDAPMLETIELAHIAGGAEITALAAVQEVTDHVQVVEERGYLGPYTLQLDSLTSAPEIVIDVADSATVDSLGSLTDVGRLQLGGSFTDLSGLASLTVVEQLQIINATKLQSLAGLETLETVTDLEITGAPLLDDVGALAAVTQMPTLVADRADNGPLYPRINISDCPALVDASPLASIPVSMLDELELSNVPSLEKLGTWSNLQSLGRLTLTNTALSDLDGLAGVSKLEGIFLNPDGSVHYGNGFDLTLVGNPELANLDGLDPGHGAAAEEIGWYSDVTIQDNAALPTCAVDDLLASLADLGRTDGSTEVDGNAMCP